MKYHATATIVVRLVGLLLLVTALPFLPTTMLALVALGWDWFSSGPAWRGWTSGWWLEVPLTPTLGVAILFSVGLYLFLGGTWVIRRVTKNLAGACQFCGYPLKGITSPNCPECGEQVVRS